VAARHAVHEQTDSGLAELVPDLDRQGSWMLYLNDVPQSHVDLDDPRYLEFEYVRRIGHLIDLAFPEAQPVRALHLGGGAMTLPRYIAATRPGSSQFVVETDAALTALVRKHLPMPGPRYGRTRVRQGDAREVLESVRPNNYDLVISDVYDGPATPSHLTTAEYVTATARALRPGGVYAVNVADGPPLKHVRGQIATLRYVYKNCCMIAEAGVLKGRRTANLVLAGGQRDLPYGELRRRCAGDPFPARVLDGAELDKFTGGAAVVTDNSSTNW
jgi:predicted O-methyltransferase YrrM